MRAVGVLASVTWWCVAAPALAQAEDYPETVDETEGAPGDAAGPALESEEPEGETPEGETPVERFARSSDAAPDERALELYQLAETAYDEGRYQDAVNLLEEALTYDPDAPDLLYNLALVYERLNDFDLALDYLERYRTNELDSEEQDRVERMMVRLRGAREHAPPPPEPEVRTRVVTRRFGLADGWFWSMVGATLLFGGSAVVTGVLALDWIGAADQFRLGDNGTLEDFHYLEDTAYTLAVLTDVAIGLASATALTALLLYVLRTRPAEETGDAVPEAPAVVPAVSVGPSGVVVGWRM